MKTRYFPKNSRGHVLRRPEAVRAMMRLVLSGFFLAGVSTFFSDGGVEAGERKKVQLTGPSLMRLGLPPARVILANASGQIEVLRTREDQAGVVTVVTGFSCYQGEMECRHIADGEYQKATTLLRAEIAAGQDGAAIRHRLGGSLFLAGDLDGAAHAYAWAASRFPRDPDVQNGLGSVYAELSQVDEAVEQFRALTAHKGYAAVAHNNLGNVYRRADRFSEALDQYQMAIKEDPRLVAAHYNRAGTLLQLEKYSEAADSFQQAAMQATKFVDSYFYEGLARLRAHQPILAAVALNRAKELGVDNPALSLSLGLANQELGLDREAIPHFRRLLSTNPSDEKVYQMLAVSLVRSGHADEAAETLEHGFELGNQDADSNFFVGLKLMLCEKPEKAARHLMRAVAKGRRSFDTFYALGQALLQSGELDGAKRTLSLAAMMKPDAAEIHLALGIVHHYQDDNDNAVREIQTAVSLDPTDVDNRAILMNFYQESGKFSECAQEGRRLVDDSPELVSPRYETALCLALSGKLDQAAETMEDALDHDTEGDVVHKIWKKLQLLVEAKKNLPGPHLLLALIHERRGNWSEAIRHYEWLVLTAPHSTWNQKALERIHYLAPSP